MVDSLNKDDDLMTRHTGQAPNLRVLWMGLGLSLVLGACADKQIYQQARTIPPLVYPDGVQPIVQQELLDIPGEFSSVPDSKKEFEFPAPPVVAHADAKTNEHAEFVGIPDKPVLLQAGNSQWFLQVEGSQSIIQDYLKRAITAAGLTITNQANQTGAMSIRDKAQAYQLLSVRQGVQTQISVNSSTQQAKISADQALLERLVNHWPTTAE